MCRLFSFKSIINSQVHSSLVDKNNALSYQSIKHPDGWGVAYYREGVPHLIKSTECAMNDKIFHRVSGVVSSQTVLAHIRKATQGSPNTLNSHPFQYGKWVFAHNGNLKNFNSYKDKLIANISQDLQHFVLGSTDSEVIFYLLLSLIKKSKPLSKTDTSIEFLKEKTQELCQLITSYSGPLYAGEDNNPQENHLTFILTNGDAMAAFQGGQKLNFSTYKKCCSEREICSFYDKSCESPMQDNQQVNHLIFSSEELEGENVWNSFKRGEFIGTDKKMKFSRFQIDTSFK